ncbi:hypothetical protein COP1_016038 [Malus domestica]
MVVIVIVVVAVMVFVIVAVVLVEGLLLVEDAALFGALLLHELVVHRPFLPRHLLLLPIQPQHHTFRLRRRCARVLKGDGRRQAPARRWCCSASTSAAAAAHASIANRNQSSIAKAFGLVHSVPGFRKEHLKDETNSMGIVTNHGERPLKETNENTWSRFHKEIQLSDKCDPNDVRAKFDKAGVLTIIMSVAHDDHYHEKVVAAAADEHNNNAIDKQKSATTATTNYDQSSDYDLNKPTSYEFKSQRIIVSTNLEMGKDVAVKLLPAAAVIVVFGFGTYVVKYYNK